MSSRKKSIVICGAGLAGNMTAISLANGLGPDHRVIQICTPAPSEDILYGNVTDPSGYNFLRNAGLDEPYLILESNTSFSYGTHYRRWLNSQSWMQCHHAPLITINGIPLRHYLTRAGMDLTPMLISAQAALAGRFAHPPGDARNLLSQAEYGYQFDVTEWTGLLEHRILASEIRRIRASVASVEAVGDTISAIRLNSGDTLIADLIVDAGGVGRDIIGAAGAKFRESRPISAGIASAKADTPCPPCRIIEAGTNGWSGTVHLQNAQMRLQVGPVADDNALPADLTVKLGALDGAWVGNCVAIGHAAWVVEPITPAPMIMLQRDIERLLELIPVGQDMMIERREFNRRFRDDVKHINMFHDALFEYHAIPDAPYWREAVTQTGSKGLARKMSQFENRGVLTSYDLEPFNNEDWTIAHFGMGRWPKQYDRQVDCTSEQESARELVQISESIKQLVSTMPPHALYISRLKQYLEKQRNA